MAHTTPVTNTDTTSTSRRRKAWALVALGVAALGIGSVATPALADSGSGDAPRGVIECTSGVITDGEVSMSALTVTRTDTLPTSPGDCSAG